MIIRRILLFMLLSPVFSGIMIFNAYTQEISTKDTPASVLTAFRKAYPKATIKAVSKETAEEKLYYKVQSMDGKTQRNVYYSPTGEAVETEESFDPPTLPKPIKEYLSKHYPKGFIVGGVFVKSKEISGYQIDVQNGKKKISLSFDAAGKLLKQ
jgi:hypothetical protein